MAVRKLADFEVELLIQLWHDESCLWDVSQRLYSNQDARKAAIKRISDKMEIADICKLPINGRALSTVSNVLTCSNIVTTFPLLLLVVDQTVIYCYLYICNCK